MTHFLPSHILSLSRPLRLSFLSAFSVFASLSQLTQPASRIHALLTSFTPLYLSSDSPSQLSNLHVFFLFHISYLFVYFCASTNLSVYHYLPVSISIYLSLLTLLIYLFFSLCTSVCLCDEKKKLERQVF